MKPLFCLLTAGLICMSSYAQPGFIETSHYIFPEFKQGVVLMKNGKRNNALLNYNSLTEEMIFDDHGQKLAISKNQLPQIDTVLIEGRQFVVQKNVFVELAYHSQWALFIEYKCKVEEQGPSTGYGGTAKTSAATAVSTTTIGGRSVYNLSLPDDVETNPYIYYWLKKDDELHKFVTLKELKKLFPDKKDEIKQYSKSHRVKYNEPETIAQLVAFLEAS